MALSMAERAFVQAMIGAGALPEDKAAALFAKCVEDANGGGPGTINDNNALSDVADRINSALRAFDIQLAAAGVPARGVWWGLVNTARDEAAEHACMFSHSELVLFHAVSSQLRDSGGVLPLADAHNLAPSCKLRVADGARAIQRLATLQWLRVVRAAQGRNAVPTVTFGPRALLELPDVRAWAREEAVGTAADDDDEEDDAMKTPKKFINGRSKSRASQNEEEQEEEEEIERLVKKERRSRGRVRDDDDEGEIEHVVKKEVTPGRRKPPPAPRSLRLSINSDEGTPIARPSSRRVTRSRSSQASSQDTDDASQGSRRSRRRMR